MTSTIGTQLAKQSGRSSAAASSAAGKEGAASVALARTTSGIRADALKSGAGSAGSATVTALDRLTTTSVTLRGVGGRGPVSRSSAVRPRFFSQGFLAGGAGGGGGSRTSTTTRCRRS